MFKYKVDQGIYARGTAFWLLTGLCFFGATTMWAFLGWDFAQNAIISAKVPVLNLTINFALIVSVVFFVAVEWGVWKLINNPKVADLLIDTEGEMKRVTWPSWDDTFNSSLIVLATVIVFLAFLAGADAFLSWFFRELLFS